MSGTCTEAKYSQSGPVHVTVFLLQVDFEIGPTSFVRICRSDAALFLTLLYVAEPATLDPAAVSDTPTNINTTIVLNINNTPCWIQNKVSLRSQKAMAFTSFRERI